MSRVRKLAEVLLEDARYITIDEERAREVALQLSELKISIPTWDFPPFYPQSDSFEEMCQYYLTFNSINYCYFDQDGKKFVDGDHSGATLAGLRLTENWDTIKDPVFLSYVDENYLLSELFVAKYPISMVKERTHALREVGQFLNANPDFSFERLFNKYQNNAYLVSQALPVHLPTWRDPFFKRTQLFVGMVYGRFQNWEGSPIDEDSLSDLTVFADYRVPQTLIGMGIIKPKAPLLTRLHQNQFLGTGSQKELELRAATIIGADKVTEALIDIKGDQSINSLHTDFILWSAARKKDTLPEEIFNSPWPNHHLTITTDY